MGSPSGAEVNNSPTMLETQVLSLDQEDPLEKGMATHFSIPIPKKGNAKECSNNHTIAHISHASHVMLRILQARLQQYVNRELPDDQMRFRKDGGNRDEIANICWITEKVWGSQKKTSTSTSLTMLKPLSVWVTTNYGKFFKRQEYQTILLPVRETSLKVKTQQLELDIRQQTSSKLGKKYVKAVSSHLVYLTYMQSTLYEMPCWMKHELESRFKGEISITLDMQMTPPLWQKARKN